MSNLFKKKPAAKSLDQNLIVQLGSEADPFDGTVLSQKLS
jgi:hypothetical protein